MTNAKKKYKIVYFLTVIFGLSSAFFMSRFSICLGKVIDVVIDPKDTLIKTMLLCLLMLLCWLFTSFLYDYSEIVYVNKITCYIKEQLYKALYSKEINEFISEKNGTYLSLYSKDIDILIDNYLIPKCDIVCNLLSAVVCLLSIFLINWKLGISFVIISMLTVIVSQLPGAVMAKKTEEYTSENKSYMALLENYLNGFEQVKLLCLEKVFREKLNQKDKEYESARKHYLFAKIFAGDIGMSFGMLSQLLCMSVGIWFALHGEMTVGALISAVQLLNGVFSPIQNFVSDKNLMGTATEIIERLEKNSVITKREEKKITEEIELIDINNISLEFGGKQIFDEYNLKLEKGKKYAIVGESGKGKSTLAKLLMKYIPKQDYNGKIRVNGYDIHDISTSSLYNKIGYVQKNEFMIDGTIKENILLYRNEISEKHVEEIGKNLNLDKKLINKEISYSTNKEVSFGEKQRIDLARFLVKDYDVLIFDEPTSNLDEKMSNDIFDTIMNIKDKIVVVITHEARNDVLNRFDELIQI